MSTCSQGAITSFPLGLAVTATDILYDSVSEPITMDIQWATRSTTPMFISPQTSCITDEVGVSNSNLSTLRFLNSNYIIHAVQIIAASHKAWILPNTLQSSNTEDIVITFSTSSTTTRFSYITFVIPIIRTANAADPNYLTGLLNPNSNGSFSLQSCFPTDPRSRFARYITCLAGSTSGAPTQNVCVFVSTSGIQVNAATMQGILTKSGRSGSFGTYSSPYTSRLTGATTITTVGDFSNKVQTTTQLLNYAGFKEIYPAVDTGLREDDTSAYQCVPIDPDSAVVDGKLKVDLKSGEVMSDVLDKRNHLRSASSVSAGMTPGRVEKYLGSALGVILTIILILSIIWGISIMLINDLPDGLSYAFADISWYIVVASITGFIGFIIGAMMN